MNITIKNHRLQGDIGSKPIAQVETPSKGGCCDGGAGATGALALGLAVGTLLLRPRRRS